MRKMKLSSSSRYGRRVPRQLLVLRTPWAVATLLLSFLVTIVAQNGTVCNICGDNGVIGSPTKVIQEPITGQDTTCGDLQDQADQQMYNSLQCSIIQFAIETACACETSTTNSSTTTTSAPVAAPTGTDAPTAAPPSSTPSLTNVMTNIIIELSNVTGRMNPNVTSVYEDETCAYLTVWSAVDATDLTCLMLAQELSNATTASSSNNGTRLLQDKPAIYMLSTLVQVTAQETSLSSEALATQLSATIEGDPTGYLDSLSLPFFQTITTVSAFAAMEAPSAAPTPAPNTGASPTVGPTSSPIASPTIAPVSTPTVAPSMAPVVPTMKPSSIPLETVEGMVAIHLEYVVGQMSDSLATEFEAQTNTYLNEQLASVMPPISSIATKVRRQVTGPSVPPSDLKALTAMVNVEGKRSDSGDISQLVADAINGNASGYLQSMRDAGSAPLQIYLKSVENVTSTPFQDTAAPAASPTTAPAPESSSGGLSTGAIVGIVIGVVLGVPVLLYILYRAWGANQKQAGLIPIGSTDSATGGDGVLRNAPPEHRATTATSLGRSSMRNSRRVEEAPSARSKSSDEDDGSSQGGVAQITTTSMAGTEQDNASYAYSMDAEAVGPSPTDISTADTSNAGGTSVGASGTTGAGSSTVSSEDVKKNRKYKRTVVAPEGKLGIIIDTTLEGPVVYKVNPNSPLEGVIFPGDLIIKIDDIETRAMSASNITTLMVQTAGQKRTLTVLSDDPHR